MTQPWLTFALIFAAGWLAYGLRVTLAALWGRKGLRGDSPGCGDSDRLQLRPPRRRSHTVV
ncbi:hypothetical protein ACFW2D_27035 [Streptomyces sp. NPDC058914]|uniref:hypothetical protein n=1 Tax=Streptomyces TaxID=1883 RepID=UPI0036891C40